MNDGMGNSVDYFRQVHINSFPGKWILSKIIGFSEDLFSYWESVFTGKHLPPEFHWKACPGLREMSLNITNSSSEMSCDTNMTEATAKLEKTDLRWRRLKSVRVLQFLQSSSSKDLLKVIIKGQIKGHLPLSRVRGESSTSPLTRIQSW